MVGGISRTDSYKGYRFDIGGHRFFSKSDEVNRLWHEILGEEFLTRSRLSRIYYDRKFFHYPLKPADALWKLGLLRSCRIVASYIKARLRPIKPERSVEDWVVNRFGRELFEIFFKSYTEKVWGVSTSTITAEWAAQRIKDLSLVRAVTSALFGKLGRRRGEMIKTLIDEFHYPRLGPGQMWEVARDRIRSQGGAVHLDRRVVRIEHDGDRVTSFLTSEGDGRHTRYLGRHFLSTLPIRDLIRAMSPSPPLEVIQAAQSLKYRDFLTVVLIVDRAETFPDNWIYIHEPAGHARPSPELQELVARPRPRSGQDQPGPGILLLRGGRPLDQDRRGTAGDRPPRNRRDRSGLGLRRDRRLRRSRPQGLSRLRRRLSVPPRR